MSLITLSNIKLPIDKSELELVRLAEKKLKRKPAYFAILKKSLDARDKERLQYIYTIEFSAQPQGKAKRKIESLPNHKLPQRPVVVVGSGPAGLFSALRLLERGIKPIVIERGAPVEERELHVSAFCEKKILNVNSNVQFGEGGAGTFSDGKLNTQTHNPLIKEVLETFVQYGAPEEILWLNKPHIGSDKLKAVVKNMRQAILNRGGQVRFHSCLSDVKIENSELKSVKITGENGEETIEPSALVLAIGHSARDTFERLLQRGVYLRQKDFSVGVRIEHLQKNIGLAQYGKRFHLLPAADYKLVSHACERAAFTFCMCPGGVVMPSASEEGGVVVNGMSNYARDGQNANSALIAQITGADFGEGALAGVEFQRKLERAAFLAGGETYAAPVQKIGDFLKGKESSCFGEVLPTYAAGTAFADLQSVLPKPIIQTLKTAIVDMDKKLKGFADPDGVLTAVESRTSSPVRIERDESFQSVSAKGLYPCGEGAGYAGGITSSAVDGIRVADAIYEKFL